MVSREKDLARSPLVWFAATVSTIFAAAMVYSLNSPWQHWSYALTIAASVGFVLMAVVGGAFLHRTGCLLLGGLFCCFLGDLTGPWCFAAGAAAFAIAHILFIATLLHAGTSLRSLLLPGIPFLISGILLFKWLFPHVPSSHRAGIFIYLCLVSLMATLAIGNTMRGSSWWFAIGALLFYVSDIFVARWKYVSPVGFNAYYCYPAYYLACILMAISIPDFYRQPQIRRQ